MAKTNVVWRIAVPDVRVLLADEFQEWRPSDYCRRSYSSSRRIRSPERVAVLHSRAQSRSRCVQASSAKHKGKRVRREFDEFASQGLRLIAVSGFDRANVRTSASAST